MDAIRVVLTYEDYTALPNDGRRYEIHDGELSVTPSPGTRHQGVSLNLLVALHAFVSRDGRGRLFPAPLDVILGHTTVVQPDIVYVAAEQRDAISARGIEGPPTLVIEILSPSTLTIDRQMKLQLYARHGVPHYWIVDPEARAVDAYTLREGGYVLTVRATGDDTLRAEPFVDLALPLASIWA